MAHMCLVWRMWYSLLSADVFLRITDYGLLTSPPIIRVSEINSLVVSFLRLF